VHDKNWFTLARHDEPETPPVVEPENPPADPPVDPPVESDPSKEDKDWRAEAEKWKALARKHEGTAKANSDAARKLAEIEESQKTEAQKLADAKEAAEKRAAQAIERAVRAEVKALAGDFADPDDAVSAVRASDYVTADGDVDTDAIQTRLAEVLEAKPHWRKPAAPTAPPKPKPDPSQGPRGDGPKPTNFLEASPEEVAAELAKYRVRPRFS
jgi:hypothetical protein